jgi:hypothetical protein
MHKQTRPYSCQESPASGRVEKIDGVLDRRPFRSAPMAADAMYLIAAPEEERDSMAPDEAMRSCDQHPLAHRRYSG